ncbi:hypothetical protein A5705_20780 [Mycobacterium sp. E787]|nr:hypothetical protein A5705_20780 [Mycobacterium sp. E787]
MLFEPDCQLPSAEEGFTESSRVAFDGAILAHRTCGDTRLMPHVRSDRKRFLLMADQTPLRFWRRAGAARNSR